jgi:hypothetical protein
MNDRKLPRTDFSRERFTADEQAWVNRYLGYADSALQMQSTRRPQLAGATRSSMSWRRSLKEMMKRAADDERSAA